LALSSEYERSSLPWLTALAVRYGAEKGYDFDTFLPERLTRYTFQFFTTAMVVGLILLTLRWSGVIPQ
jgi:hypothetical protein